jgi:hypothetical protein
LESASDPRLVQEVHGPALELVELALVVLALVVLALVELEPGSCRQVASGPGPETALDQGLGPESQAASVRGLCRAWAAERVWGTEIGLKTCPRRGKTAPPICKIAWPMAAIA